jgi:hypothetical protein
MHKEKKTNNKKPIENKKIFYYIIIFNRIYIDKTRQQKQNNRNKLNQIKNEQLISVDDKQLCDNGSNGS